MINIDYLADLGLKGGSGNKGCMDNGFNIVVNYIIDDTSTDVMPGDLLTFVDDKVKTAEALDVVNAIALEGGISGATIKCQVFGIVNIPNTFIAGKHYYNNAGVLSDVESGEYLGLAITKDELLLKEGVFIHD